MTMPVKWFSSEMEGAPNMGKDVAVNKLIPVLRAFLVDGFGSRAVASATYANGEITFTFSAAHKYLVDSVVLASGANEAQYNGEFRVKSVTTTTVVCGTDNGTPVAASATGTLAMKVPSLGWTVKAEDSANNRIIFASTDPAANGLALLVDNGAWTDDGAWNSGNTSGQYGIRAKVTVVSNVVDINTYTVEIGPHPWPASHKFADSTWYAIGDSRLFHFLPKFMAWNWRGWFTFGDGVSVRPGDKFMTMLTILSIWGGGTGSDSRWDTASNWYGRYNDAMKMDTTSDKYIARSYHQLPGPIGFRMVGTSLTTKMSGGLSFPNPSDNGFYVQAEPPMVFAGEADFRGYMPGVRNPLANNIGLDKAILKNLPNIPGRSLLCLLAANEKSPTASSASSATNAIMCFDISGPWR